MFYDILKYMKQINYTCLLQTERLMHTHCMQVRKYFSMSVWSISVIRGAGRKWKIAGNLAVVWETNGSNRRYIAVVSCW